MSELKEIVACAGRLRTAGRPFLTATLVSVRGSSYRRPGARFVVSDDGFGAGSISGGCLEREVGRRGWWHTQGGAPSLVTYDSTFDDGELGARIGLGCNGVVELLVERIDPSADTSALRFIEACLAREREGVLATVFRSATLTLPVGAWVGIADDGAVDGTASDALRSLARTASVFDGPRTITLTVEGAVVEALVEAIRPPPHLFVMGAGSDAVPLVQLGVVLGWTVSVWDPSARFESRVRFAAADHRHTGAAASLAPVVAAAFRPVAVVMSHDFERDREALSMLLRSPVSYLGVLGPRHRTSRLLADLAPVANERLYAPAGLSVGAETPAEIAMSIVTEIQSVLAGVAVGSLRDRPGPIHASGVPSPGLRIVG
jgi:xanthine dehydrogenase accessory factor